MITKYLGESRPALTGLGVASLASPATSIEIEAIAKIDDMQMNTTPTQSNLSVLLRMEAAINTHDIDAFVNCFAPDFVGEHPVHPERNLIGAEQVRKNWTALFAYVPDIQAELITHTIADELGWSEWHWQGNHTNGTKLDMRGVVVVGLRESEIAWARLYMEPLAQVVQADIL